MAEVAKRTGEGMPPATPFIEFVMMQAQNILFMLGLIPTPDGRRARPDTDSARLLIDQLGMIKEKTRGNLTEDESSVLNEMLSRVRLTFVEVARSLGEDPKMDLPTNKESEDSAQNFTPNSPKKAPPADEQIPSAPKPNRPTIPSTEQASRVEEENKKRFVKSFG